MVQYGVGGSSQIIISLSYHTKSRSMIWIVIFPILRGAIENIQTGASLWLIYLNNLKHSVTLIHYTGLQTATKTVAFATKNINYIYLSHVMTWTRNEHELTSKGQLFYKRAYSTTYWNARMQNCMLLMKKNRLDVWHKDDVTYDNSYRMHWGGAQTTLGGPVMLMVHYIGTDSV